MFEFTARGQPAVETAAGDTSRHGGRICLVHIASSDLQSEPHRCLNSPPETSQRLKPLLEIRPGLTAESASSMSQAPIFSRSAAPMPEFTDRGQPAVETAAGDTSDLGGRICLVHIASSDLQSERRSDA
jgi:hypothetical protein